MKSVQNTGKYGPEKTPYLDNFHAVLTYLIRSILQPTRPIVMLRELISNVFFFHALGQCWQFSEVFQVNDKSCRIFFIGDHGGRIVELYKRPTEQLGLSITPSPAGNLTVSYIQPGSAAGKAPLRLGDRVLSINGTQIEDHAQAQVCFLGLFHALQFSGSLKSYQ